MVSLDGMDLRGAKIVIIPEDIEDSIGGRGRGQGGVVNGEGKNEMKFNTGVYWNIGESHIFEIGPNIFSKELGIWGCLGG